MVLDFKFVIGEDKYLISTLSFYVE